MLTTPPHLFLLHNADPFLGVVLPFYTLPPPLPVPWLLALVLPGHPLLILGDGPPLSTHVLHRRGGLFTFLDGDQEKTPEAQEQELQ